MPLWIRTKAKNPSKIPGKLGPNQSAPWRKWLYKVIFESDTPAGKHFDLLLIAAISFSVATVMLDSVRSIRE